MIKCSLHFLDERIAQENVQVMPKGECLLVRNCIAFTSEMRKLNFNLNLLGSAEKIKKKMISHYWEGN